MKQDKEIADKPRTDNVVHLPKLTPQARAVRRQGRKVR